MRFVILGGLLLSLTASLAPSAALGDPQTARITASFDGDWRFCKADAAGAEKPDFDDAAWRRLDVPHDWSIEGPFDRDHPTGRGGAYLPAGVGWYRKHFTLPAAYAGRRVFVDFDGVMAHSDIWINGHHLGNRPFGYVSFRYELTGHLNFGPTTPNLIAVRADNSAQPASRWYSGAGIYRHVRLVVADPVHIAHWGVYVSTPSVDSARAVVRVQTTVVNQSDEPRHINLHTVLEAPDGRVVATAETPQDIAAGTTQQFQQDIAVAQPQLWDLEQPNLYRAVSKILADASVIDDEITPFGIRHFTFEADTGFWLNGKNLKIKGVCLHHDAGGLGAAVPARAWQRRLEGLRQIGCNAVRTAHNPAAPEFLDLCDRMGFLVMDEVLDAWTVGKNHADYGYQRIFGQWWRADTRDTVLRDRNHPCIILYSAGNEIRDNLDSEHGFETFTAMRDLFHELDPTRPVTMGLFRPNQGRVYDNGFAELMDVIGQNYREAELVAAHRARPERKVIGTENGHDRRVWLVLRDQPFMAGQFLWTGIDYLGEADWPRIAWANAPIDRTGRIRPLGYQRQSWWSATPMVHIARRESASGGASGRIGGGEIVSHWTPRDPDTYDEALIEVYSNCEQVELVLNETSLGAKPRPADDAPRNWELTYVPGTLRALGRNQDRLVATHEIRTAGEPVAVRLTADRATLRNDWDDISCVTATIVDENGVCCPWADDLVSFTLSGPGAIAAVDNGDPASHESFQQPRRRAYHGQCLVVIRAGAVEGQIVLNATAPDRKPDSLTIDIAATETRD
ncbi:MAG: DUF4982 domain-containing protein [Sedimentisphaerales bacterium]|nr:DUF4982 domain-containing protein [Sedimentisphaerales bacterium]